MTRKISFRAWDKKNKKMITSGLDYELEVLKRVEGDEKNHSYIGFHESEQELFELMQSTGLKDKDGKEAYFRDYVKLQGSEDIWELLQDDFGIPVFSNTAKLEIISFEKYFVEYAHIHSENSFEIIGNQFEHPELLKTNTQDTRKT